MTSDKSITKEEMTKMLEGVAASLGEVDDEVWHLWGCPDCNEEHYGDLRNAPFSRDLHALLGRAVSLTESLMRLIEHHYERPEVQRRLRELMPENRDDKRQREINSLFSIMRKKTQP